jgi:hypothetical protein
MLGAFGQPVLGVTEVVLPPVHDGVPVGAALVVNVLREAMGLVEPVMPESKAARDRLCHVGRFDLADNELARVGG